MNVKKSFYFIKFMDYEAILKQQVADQRTSQATTPRSSTSSLVKKQVFIPLKEPSNKYVDSEVNTTSMAHNETTDVKIESKDDTQTSKTEKAEISVQAAKESGSKSGGKLWGPPLVDTKKTISSELNTGSQESKNDSKGPSLFSLCMAPQPEPPKRTLYTYYDLLKNDGKL